MRKTWWLLLVLPLAPALGSAQTYTQSVIVVDGDAAPGTGGGSYFTFTTPSIGPSGGVALESTIVGGSAGEGVFVDASGVTDDVALFGDAAPDTGGGSYQSLLPPVMGVGGAVFHSTVFGGTVSSGIFRGTTGADTAVALSGDTAPGTGGGTYSTFFSFFTINDSGDVAFVANVTGGSTTQGIFVDSGGVDAAVTLAGDAAPGTGGGTYSTFGSLPGINASGDVAFLGNVSGGSVAQGIFVDSGGTDTERVLAGDTAPGTGGETYTGFGAPSMNDAGEIAFLAPLTGAVSSGVFVDAGGTQTLLALVGDTAPGTGGGSFVGFNNPIITQSGDVVIRATVSGGSATQGIFLLSAGASQAIALAGEAAPGTGGGSYSSFSGYGGNASGEVAFSAVMTGGTVTRGVFRATPASFVPALPPPGFAVLALSLGIAARRAPSAARTSRAGRSGSRTRESRRGAPLPSRV